MTVMAEDLVAAARALLGVRFAHQGRDAAHGVDCLGLLLVVAGRLGVQFNGQAPMALDVPNYRTRPDTNLLQQRLSAVLLPVAPDAMRIADIVLLRIDAQPQHLAIISDYPVAGEFGMIHAHAAARKVVEHRYDTHWRKATHAVYRLREVYYAPQLGVTA